MDALYSFLVVWYAVTDVDNEPRHRDNKVERYTRLGTVRAAATSLMLVRRTLRLRPEFVGRNTRPTRQSHRLADRFAHVANSHLCQAASSQRYSYSQPVSVIKTYPILFEHL